MLIPVSGHLEQLETVEQPGRGVPEGAGARVAAEELAAAASASVAAIPAARPEVSSLAIAAASAGPPAGAMVTVASRAESSAHS